MHIKEIFLKSNFIFQFAAHSHGTLSLKAVAPVKKTGRKLKSRGTTKKSRGTSLTVVARVVYGYE